MNRTKAAAPVQWGQRRTLLILATLAVTIGFATACGGGAGPVELGGRAALPAEPAGGGSGTSGVAGGSDTGAGGEATGTAPAASDAAALPGSAGSTVAPQDGALIVKTGTFQLQVGDLDAALAKANAAVVALGGYVSASDRRGEGEQQVAVVTYRIPAAHWDEALAALRPLATRIVTEQTQAVDVTGQVLDLGARIENLRVTERALQEIMARATRISDVLAVQAQLTDVRGQIEQLSTEKAHLSRQAAYGTLTVTYEVPVVAVTQAASGWDPGRELDDAAAQLVEIAQLAASAAIWFGVVGLPLLLAGLLLVGMLALVGRRVLPRRPRDAPPGPAWGGTRGV